MRSWPFAKLWAISAAIWLLSFVLSELLDYFDRGNLSAFAVGIIPAFLAGGWAGSHPEIATWPRARLAVMWVLALAAFLGATDYVDHWRALALFIVAPVAILSARWYELTLGRPLLPSPSPDSHSIVSPSPSPPEMSGGHS